MLTFKDVVFGIVVEGTFVEGIKEEVVLSPTHALSLIAAGEGCTDVLMVIAKLTDGKETHIPYRDSKLTRLLQSSLSGHGRISLICTVTLAYSSSEETHNTLKFAHRSKHVEIKAFLNKIMDEKSLIKKYQKEISELKQELQQLKRGMVENPNMATSSQEDLITLKLQGCADAYILDYLISVTLEAGQSKLKSRLQEEEQAKATLMRRIQRLTKLILVSTKNAMSSSIAERPSHRRRHSFGEDEDTVNSIVTDILQWPHRIVVPLGGIPIDTSERELKPQGKLALTVVKATTLKYMEMIGKSDPNVVVHIQPLFKYKTNVLDNNLNPFWNEKFELIAEDKETQSLILESAIVVSMKASNDGVVCLLPSLVS
ncbi:Kinesin-related protein 11 [Glycine soja]|uniref:Kinesin-related protein 11 n=1 Tax=Glycine soja TaxID=3848 RepID=A0A0B2Q3R6_GLYSO|nr:Kinesin-related protein 11 [Glycine soja]